MSISFERLLTRIMKDQLKIFGISASYQDYIFRKDHLMNMNDGFHQILDFIPDFIMIDLLKEYECEVFCPYQNMDEFAEGILGYKHGNVQVMRKIARHFFIFNPDIKEFVLDKDFKGLALHN